jgi:iron complex outermembrane receptor protein
MKIKIYLALLPILFFSLTVISAQEKSGSLNGRVQSEKKEPVGRINVYLEGTTIVTVTDDNGDFVIEKVPAGEYTLVASGVGFKALKKNVSVVAGQATTLSLELDISVSLLSEVVVTDEKLRTYYEKYSTAGTRLPLTLLETPQTIQVISNQVLKDQQTQNLNDVTRNMTGVINNNMYSSYTMRGFTNSYYNQFLTFDGFVGNPYQWTQMVQLYNVDRVEMIAGPASALYSTGSPGGVINMMTKRPLAENRYSFNVVTGSWNLIDVSADLTGPLSKDKKLLYRLNFGYNNANSFRPSQFNSNIVVAPSLTYNFSDKTNINIDYVYAGNDTRYGQDHGGLLLMNKDSTYNWKGVNNTFLFNSPKDHQNIVNNNLTLRLNHKFSETIQFTYLSRAIWSHQNGGEHYGDYYADNYFTTVPDSMHRAYDTWDVKPYNFQNSAFVRIALGKNKIRQTLLVGGDYQVYGESYNRYVNGKASTISFTNPDYTNDNFNYPITSDTYVWDVKEETRQIGIYLQDMISINNKINVLLAGRYEDFYFSRKPNSADANVTRDTSVAHVFLPRFGLVYNLTKSHTLYGSYCESFQPQYDNSRSTGGPYPPQTGRQYETGYKGLFFDGKLMSSLALYSIEYVNILKTDPKDPSGVRQIVVPGLTSKGVEFTVQGNIKQFSVIAGYAYNHVEFSGNSPLGPKGGRYDNAPNVVANLWLKYSLPEHTILKGLNLAVGGKYVGDRVGWATNQHFHMPSYSVLDASINYSIDRFLFQLNGFNVLNEKYVLGYYASDLMVQVGTPVNWKLGIRYTIK